MKCEIRYAFGPCDSVVLDGLQPLLTVWPTYDGFCKDDFEESGRGELPDEIDAGWSKIVSSALAQISAKVTSLEFFCPKSFFWQSPKPRWRKAKDKYQQLDQKSLAVREGMGHGLLLHLLSPRALPELGPQDPNLGQLREQLTAALNFGIEEAVLYSWWADPQLFLIKLAQQAEKYGHTLIESPPFSSHWRTTGRGYTDYSEGSPSS